MQTNYTIVMFLKFGKKEDIVDLFENGTVYINSIQYFRGIEDKCLRGDAYEGVSSIYNSLPGQFEILGKTINYLSIHLPQSFDEVFGNIYSLYCVSSYGFKTPNDFKIDEKVRDFGTHFILIKKPGEFLNRIKSKLNLLGQKYKNGFVEYYDTRAVNGKMHLFQKPKEYEYQKEFRIYVERNEITPLIIKIGNLRDIAEIHTSDIVSEIKLIGNNTVV